MFRTFLGLTMIIGGSVLVVAPSGATARGGDHHGSHDDPCDSSSKDGRSKDGRSKHGRSKDGGSKHGRSDGWSKHGGYGTSTTRGSYPTTTEQPCETTTTKHPTTTQQTTTTSASTTTSTSTSTTSPTAVTSTTLTQQSIPSSTTTTATTSTTVVEPTFQFTAVPRCTKDAPWIDLTASAAGFSGQYTLHWVDAGGTERMTQLLALGATSILYPGAAVAADGTGIEWPGWVQQAGGEWVEADDGFAWVRQSGVRVFATVNPTSAPVTLVYPPSTPTCQAAPHDSAPGVEGAVVVRSDGTSGPDGASTPIAFTGGHSGLGLAIGVALVIAGGVVMAVDRRRSPDGVKG